MILVKERGPTKRRERHVSRPGSSNCQPASEQSDPARLPREIAARIYAGNVARLFRHSQMPPVCRTDLAFSPSACALRRLTHRRGANTGGKRIEGVYPRIFGVRVTAKAKVSSLSAWPSRYSGLVGCESAGAWQLHRCLNGPSNERGLNCAPISVNEREMLTQRALRGRIH